MKAFEGNPYDSKFIEILREQVTKNDLTLPEEVVYDCDRSEEKQIRDTIISTAYNRPLKRNSQY
jgi:hypothetical protein